MAASAPPAFVHLHAHSSYSLSEGAIKADKLAALARDAGMPAVALTDTANLFGALEFSQSCSAKGVQPIMGCQLWLGREHLEGRGASAGGDPERNAPDPVVALAMDARGLDNLQRLSSLSFLGSDLSGRPCVKLDTLREHAAGLFLLTGGTLGPVSRLLSEGRRDAAADLLAALREAFPDRLAVELHRRELVLACAEGESFPYFRRRYERVACELPVRVYPEEGPKLQATVVEISEGGLSLGPDHGLKLDAVIGLSVSFPGKMRPLRLQGRVASVVPGAVERRVGVEFLFESSRQKERVGELIARLRAGQPQ